MKEKIKQYWILFVLIGFLSFYYIQQAETENEELSFDIDIYSLSYELPKHTLICLPKTKYLCVADDICENIKPSTFVLYDSTNNLLYRCDNKPCDKYDAIRERSGLFFNIEPILPRGMMMKIAEGGEYFETVSFGLDVLISYGQCYNR